MPYRFLILIFVVISVYMLKKLFNGERKAEMKKLPVKYKPDNDKFPTLVYFWTESCSQCRYNQNPVIQQLKTNDINFNLISVNALEDREITALLKIKTVPSTAVFSASGRSVFINNGFKNKEELTKQLNESLI